MGYVEKTGRSVIRGLSRDQAGRLENRLEESTTGLKSEAGRRIESLAAQIRKLGVDLESPFEAGRLARELERTADYLRYRRSIDMAGDAWDAIRHSPVAWAAGAAVGALLVYGVVRRTRR
jgi:hypothetical protein